MFLLVTSSQCSTIFSSCWLRNGLQYYFVNVYCLLRESGFFDVVTATVVGTEYQYRKKETTGVISSENPPQNRAPQKISALSTQL